MAPNHMAIISLAIIALAASSSCFAQPVPGNPDATRSSQYQLVDSRFPSNEQYRPFWLDNQRVIFRGYEVGSYDKVMHGTPPPEMRAKGYDLNGMRTGYYIWDTKSGDVRLYKDRIEDLCVDDEQTVIYRTASREGERSVVWRGKFGEEQPTSLEPWPYRALQRNCWEFLTLRTEVHKGRHTLFLRPDWGYLDIGPSNPPYDARTPVLYYRAGKPEPFELPIPGMKLKNGGRVTYVSHEKRHFLVEGQGDAAKMPQAWFLSVDGELREITFPIGPWSSVALYPVKRGIVISSAHARGRADPDTGGMYLVQGDKWQLLFKGMPRGASVSPDGCNVALSYAPNRKAFYSSGSEQLAGRTGALTMRMVNVCERG